MNDIESRLAEAMAARANAVEPKDENDALDRINRRLGVTRRTGLAVLGVAAALALVIGAVALLRRDNGNTVKVGIAASTTTAPSSTTTTANTTPASVIPANPNTAIWPFDSMNRSFDTPEAAAKSFAVDYLGMTHARVGVILNADSSRADVEIFPNDRGSARTLVQVAQQPPRGWVVLGATADDIKVDAPKPHDALPSQLTLSGQSVAFEAQVGVQLRPFGSTTSLVQDFVMGGSTELQPFSKQIAVPSTDQPLVLVLFEGDASGEQTFTKATVIPLDAAGPKEPTQAVAQTERCEFVTINLLTGDMSPTTPPSIISSTRLPPEITGSAPTPRGRFGTIAFFDGDRISSYNPANGKVVQLVKPAATPTSLDADDSGRFLLWVDTNHDLWKWSGSAPVKVGSGFNSAAW
ncbi:MAG: hypothetical protein QOC92_2063 [Acidimicrobiaceae bacterium]|jgi:hypothetical protein